MEVSLEKFFSSPGFEPITSPLSLQIFLPRLGASILMASLDDPQTEMVASPQGTLAVRARHLRTTLSHQTMSIQMSSLRKLLGSQVPARSPGLSYEPFNQASCARWHLEVVFLI